MDSPHLAAGTFRLSFSTEPTALAAAREARTRGFIVDVTKADDRWQHHARTRAGSAVDDLDRYASRLRKLAVSFEGTYEGFTAD
jgi:hypothetical protein